MTDQFLHIFICSRPALFPPVKRFPGCQSIPAWHLVKSRHCPIRADNGSVVVSRWKFSVITYGRRQTGLGARNTHTSVLTHSWIAGENWISIRLEHCPAMLRGTICENSTGQQRQVSKELYIYICRTEDPLKLISFSPLHSPPPPCNHSITPSYLICRALPTNTFVNMQIELNCFKQ